CLAIRDDPSLARRYTNINNTVAIVTNGTAILGLGNIGPLAVGAAAYAAGLPMRSALPGAPDPEVSGGTAVTPEQIAGWLRAGEDVAWFSGLSGTWSWHRGDRCVWSLREGGRPAFREPPADLDPSLVACLRPALRAGSALPRRERDVPGRRDVVLADDGMLARVLELLDGQPIHLRRMKIAGTRVARVADAEVAARTAQARLVVGGRLP
ncbi:MAG: hypothetical protein KC656_15655, partial [Myxococcales bacterium]|nr:hypothetical protein [Myxococcales bacterium]